MLSKVNVLLSKPLVHKNMCWEISLIPFLIIFVILLSIPLCSINSQILYMPAMTQSEDSTLVGYWSFNECYGDTVHDLSLYANHGNITKADWVNLGGENCGLFFDTTFEYVRVGDDPSFNQLSQLTMEAVVIIDSLPNNYYNHCILQKESNFNLTPFTSDSIVHAGIYSNQTGWLAVMSKSKVSIGSPVYIAATVDALTKEMKMYINGVLDAETTYANFGNWGTSSDDIFFGVDCTQGGCYHQFYGRIDWIRLWRKIITFGPDSYSLISPMNYDSVKTLVSLKWQTSTITTPDDTVRYALYLSRHPSFDPDSGAILVHDNLTDTTYTGTLDSLKLWYWKVKAYDKWRAERWSDQTWCFYVYLCGDCNGDGLVELGDVVCLITYLYKSGPAPVPLLAGDCNCDGIVELGDVVCMISYLYKSGPAPCQECR